MPVRRAYYVIVFAVVSFILLLLLSSVASAEGEQNATPTAATTSATAAPSVTATVATPTGASTSTPTPTAKPAGNTPTVSPTPTSGTAPALTSTPTPAATPAAIRTSTPTPMPTPLVVVTTTAPLLDWEIPNGRFFTQANGFPLASSPKGFAITDDSVVRFWSEFGRLGGVEVVGYPVSNRFEFGGFTLQVMQKGVLQWRPDVKKAWFVNVFDLLHDSDKDEWLFAFRSVPKPLESRFDDGKNWEQVMKTRLELLDQFPSIKARYGAVSDPLTLYGLPTSKVQELGGAHVARLQRVVIQQWKIDTPWAKAGDVTVANGGDVAKDAGLFPPKALLPVFAPAGTWKLTTAYKVSGKSTWYGSAYHGRPMANGQVYDMFDPTTVASNMYPFGTKLKVTYAKAGASTMVVVKDTGAFRFPIVVDLSQAAFAKLANPAVGVIDVLVEIQP